MPPRAVAANQFLHARTAVHERLAEPQLAPLVEPFDPARYNRNMTVAENVLFGTALGLDFAPDALSGNAHLAGVLAAAGVSDDLIALGQQQCDVGVRAHPRRLKRGLELVEREGRCLLLRTRVVATAIQAIRRRARGPRGG